MRLFGIPESEIAKSLREIEDETDLSPLEITTCLRRGELEIDIRHRPGPRRRRRRWRAGSSTATGRFVFSADGSTIDEQVADLLAIAADRARRVVHRGAAGRPARRPAGGSSYLAGGVVAYSNEAKIELLGVPAELIERHGAVSPRSPRRWPTARWPASAPTSGSGSPASPARGGTKEKPVGYVCFCVKVPGGPRSPATP